MEQLTTTNLSLTRSAWLFNAATTRSAVSLSGQRIKVRVDEVTCRTQLDQSLTCLSTFAGTSLLAWAEPGRDLLGIQAVADRLDHRFPSDLEDHCSLTPAAIGSLATWCSARRRGADSGRSQSPCGLAESPPSPPSQRLESRQTGRSHVRSKRHSGVRVRCRSGLHRQCRSERSRAGSAAATRRQRSTAGPLLHAPRPGPGSIDGPSRQSAFSEAALVVCFSNLRLTPKLISRLQAVHQGYSCPSVSHPDC